MHTFDQAHSTVTIVDDVLALCGAAFLLCTYLIFWALRTPRSALAQTLSRVADVMFLIALSAMTAMAFIMLYTLW